MNTTEILAVNRVLMLSVRRPTVTVQQLLYQHMDLEMNAMLVIKPAELFIPIRRCTLLKVVIDVQKQQCEHETRATTIVEVLTQH